MQNESQSTAPKRRGRVLVIDDELAIARSIQRVLGTEHDVEIELDGRHALERLLGGESFDVVFCDLMMPNVTGMDVFDALTSKRADVAARFVFLTGGAFTQRARDFLDVVRNPVVNKPFTAEGLRAILRSYMV